MDIQELKAKRFQFLNELYDAVSGSRYRIIDGMIVAKKIGIERPLMQHIMDYLHEEGLAKRNGRDAVAITHEGIREIERARTEPDEPTEHFPPMVNILNISGGVHGSAIMQGSPGASQSVHIVGDRVEDLRGLLAEMKDAIEKIGQEAKDNRDLEVQIATIEAQLIASKPKASIIKECLQSARAVFEGVAGNVIASGIVAKIAPFMATL